MINNKKYIRRICITNNNECSPIELCEMCTPTLRICIDRFPKESTVHCIHSACNACDTIDTNTLVKAVNKIQYTVFTIRVGDNNIDVHKLQNLEMSYNEMSYFFLQFDTVNA